MKKTTTTATTTTGPKRGRGKPRTKGPLDPMIEKAGSMEALAEQIGVDYTTISRWNRKAQVPSKSQRQILAIHAAQQGLDAPFSVQP